MRRFFATLAFAGILATPALLAERYLLLTGVDSRLYPGSNRTIGPSPGPGFPGTFNDGDRLAGTSDVGPTVPFYGLGTPMYQPNQFGSLSFLFKRGSAPAGPGSVVPLMGIDFLGGPRLDLDGNAGDATRSFVPVGQTPVEIPGLTSFIDLGFDFEGQSIQLFGMDATGNNESGPFVTPDIATVLVTLAGTGPQGETEIPPNPTWDQRTGTLAPYTGTSGTLSGVYRVTDLACELWYDSIDPGSSSFDTLGTFQYFANFRGWLIQRNPSTKQFPTLAGQGLGSTRWPEIAVSQVGQVVNTAHGLAGGTATIAAGKPADDYTVAGNGGVALAAFGGDVGAYLDAVVIPQLSPHQYSFVYLESAGFGVNNSGDPVFTDTIGYDVVFLAAQEACNPCDLNCDGSVNQFDIQPFIDVLVTHQGCSPCAGDTNADGTTNTFDINAFIDCLIP